MKSTGILLGIVLALAGPLVAAEPVSVVVLPPAVAEGASTEQVAAAELWCDQLAEAMEKLDGVSVVDRTAIAKVLAERKLDNTDQAALSFDAMIRVAGEVAAKGSLSRWTLSVIDLSTGNELGKWRLGEKPNEKTIDGIARKIAQVVSKTVEQPATGTKVRIVGLIETQMRMTPLGNRMVTLFETALKKNSTVQLIHHLGAANATQESLLILMGLTKLPGGRMFAPQADATMEFRVIETDAIGKTFEQTGIEISGRVQQAGAAQAKWVTVAGTVAEYDQLAKKVWMQLAKQLPALSAVSNTQMFDALAARRKQAKLEITAGDDLRRTGTMTAAEYRQLKADRYAIARKLDPMNETASRKHILACADVCYFTKPSKSPSERLGVLELAIEHDRRFGPEHESSLWILSTGHDVALVISPGLLRPNGGNNIPTPVRRRAMELCKQGAELAMQGRGGRAVMALKFMRAWRGAADRMGIDREERLQWLEAMFRKQQAALDRYDRQKELHRIPRGNVDQVCFAMLATGGLAVLDQDMALAKRCLSAVQKWVVSDVGKGFFHGPGKYSELKGRLGRWVARCGTPEMQEEYKVWKTTAFPSPVRALSFPYSALYGFGGSGYRHSGPTFTPTPIFYLLDKKRRRALIPLGFDERSFYALSYNPCRVVRIGLDSSGRPEPLSKQVGPTMPKLKHKFDRTGSVVHGGKVYIACKKNGLLIYDGKWTVKSIADGLPTTGISGMHLIDGKLLCYGIERQRMRTDEYRFWYDPKTNEVTLATSYSVDTDSQTKKTVRTGTPIWGPYGSIWRSGEVFYGLPNRDRTLVVGLMTAKPTSRRIVEEPQPYYRGWAWVGDHFYLQLDSNSLAAFDRKGNRVETVPLNRKWTLPGYAYHPYLTQFEQVAMPIHQLGRSSIKGDGRFLWLTHAMLLYDTKEKVWYGPLAREYERKSAIASPAGLWVRESGLVFYDRESYMAECKKYGRWGKLEDYKKFVDTVLEDQPTVLRALSLLGLRRFEESQATLDAYFANVKSGKEKKDRYYPLAILLQGMLLDLQNPKAVTPARTWYQKLVAMDDSKAKFTGLYMQLPMLVREKQWPEAATILKQIRQQFPVIEGSYAEEIDGLEKRIKQNIKSKETP